ncbi:ABC transporter permease [Streptomyces peucetius]|uniref:ABC transporter permease n=1 Tax=Streptomyces peucetius TaxID=1950 RepID=A0ABY6I5H3_STRPE|nr:ABC transporter permease [Streptomyces peucetius]UYQ62168.1 ABC transporter permease [Streptomyces peucetius]
MTGFVLLRVRAHRLLLAAALLAVLLTTCVLASLAAFSGSVGDAALRHTLNGRDAAAAALTVTAQVPEERRDAAEDAVVRGAERSFGGLPVTVRSLERSGPYALPRTLQDPEARKGKPDLTHFAALDETRIAMVSGTRPGPATAGAVPVALPESAAQQLGLEPGARLTLTDRLSDKPITVRLTGLYRPVDTTHPYWQLDSLGGRGVRTVVFTTYGPLLAHPSVLASGRVAAGSSAWLATADFGTVTTDRVGALRASAAGGPKALGKDPAFAGGVTVHTSLPTVLAQSERALLVARSTLLIVAVQLVLLAAYALLLVARLLSTERAGETDLLRARGASRRRIVSLAAVEALLLALPAALCAPLLSGPLTRLLAEHSTLARSGLRLGEAPTAQVWLVAAGVAVCCAAAVVAPALAATSGALRLRRGRGGTLPASVRAGADVGLLAVAAVAYWQLDRQTGAAGGGAISGDREGDLGIDPLLVAAPALALLAGTVLTLRLLPPAARLAERRAAGGRGLPAALAGWQFSRRPLRGAGPVLLLVLAVAMGMLAIGQSASWDRSQSDQADFRAGASVRVTDSGAGRPGDTGLYASVPGVRQAAPAHRADLGLSGNRTATVLALDTARADEQLLLRDDLTDEPPGSLLGTDTAVKKARPGVLLPDDARRLTLDLRIADEKAPSGLAPQVTVIVEDRYGLAYRMSAGKVAADGRVHPVTVTLDESSSTGHTAPAGPRSLTGLRLDGEIPDGPAATHRLTIERLRTTGADGTARTVPAPGPPRWQAGYTELRAGEPQTPEPLRPAASGSRPLDLRYGIGPDPMAVNAWGDYVRSDFSVVVTAARPAPPRQIPAVATDEFLRASGAKRGDVIDVTLTGETLRVEIVGTARALPTTGPGATAAAVPADGEGAATDRQNADGGALLLDLPTVNTVIAARGGSSLRPTEWWLSTDPGRAEEVAQALRGRPDADPGQVLVRDEAADELLGDPLGAGPRSALMAVALAAAALAAVGFAVSAAASLRERSAELAVLRALGAPRRQLARLVAAEQSLLIAIALMVGIALGAVLTRAVVPLIVLTGQATRPVPHVLIELPVDQVGLLLAGVAALPLLIVAVIALRRADPAVTLRHRGEN